MAENKGFRLQRLAAIEKFAEVCEASKNKWRDAKDALARARKEYEKDIDALTRMIREKSDTPLFDEDED